MPLCPVFLCVSFTDLTWLITCWVTDVTSWGELHLCPVEAYWFFGLASDILLLSISLIQSSGGSRPWQGTIPMSTSSSTSSCFLALEKGNKMATHTAITIVKNFRGSIHRRYSWLPLLDPQQPCLPKVFDEVCVNLSMSLPVLLLLLSKSIAGVHIAIAWDTSKYGPEEDKDSKKKCFHIHILICCWLTKAQLNLTNWNLN